MRIIVEGQIPYQTRDCFQPGWEHTLPCPHQSALLRLLLGLETKGLMSGTVREPLGSYTAFRLYCHVFSIPSPEYIAFKGKKQMNCGAILSYLFLSDGSVTQTQ